MSKDKNITISINITKELNKKLEKFANAMECSKSQLCQNALNAQLDKYYKAWKLMRDPEALDRLIEQAENAGYEDYSLLAVKKELEENPEYQSMADDFINQIDEK